MINRISDSPPAIIRQVYSFEACGCPTCRRLDKRFPGGGFQLALWRYSPIVAPPPRDEVVVRLADARARKAARDAK